MTSPADPARLTVWLRGRVQGVGMRWSVRSRALSLGLDGWARNTDDGRVEIVAEGPRQELLSLLAALQPGTGLMPGRITAAVDRWSAATGVPGGFSER